jgi:hypothetical protein
MIADFYEEIRVGVIFSRNGIRPVWFSMDGHKIVVKEIYYSWTERFTGAQTYKFTVTDGEKFYELHFSGNDMRWYLAAVG